MITMLSHKLGILDSEQYMFLILFWIFGCGECVWTWICEWL